MARTTRLPLMPAFDARLYRWERNYFAEQCLRQWAGIRPELRQAAIRELALVARRLMREPLALIHRDLQSSNILLTPRGPAFIDFQGMRMGAAAYDLASLLCDPYVALPESLQHRLLACYNRRARVPVPETVFHAAAVERLAQAMGAYARLSRIPGMEHFERHILQAAEQMFRNAAALGCMPAIERTAQRMMKFGVRNFNRD